MISPGQARPVIIPARWTSTSLAMVRSTAFLSSPLSSSMARITDARTPRTASITALCSGWFRCWVTKGDRIPSPGPEGNEKPWSTAISSPLGPVR